MDNTPVPGRPDAAYISSLTTAWWKLCTLFLSEGISFYNRALEILWPLHEWRLV
jgi:hypothetical protein